MEIDKKENRARLFIENFIVYGFGGIVSKIIPLFMLPIITRLMPNSTYLGISDMANTIVSFGSALATIGMYDAMYRMFFEKDDDLYKKAVCSTTIVFTLATSLAVFLLMIVFREKLTKLFFGGKKLEYIIYLSAIATTLSTTNSIIAAPTRMQNKRKIFLITNTIAPLLSYGVSILLLLKGWYIIAIPISTIVSGLIMEISFYIMNHKWFRLKLFDKSLLKQLLRIAIPLFPNFIIYWIFNSSDRLMITSMIGVGAEGVYSVGSKLGSVSQLIYIAFASGWQYFSFTTMRDENQVELNSKIFEYLGVLSFVVTSFVCALSRFVFQLLFTGEYINGYVVAPYLFLAPLLQMLFQVACNQFLIIKKTWPNMFILLWGAIVNIILNLKLIPVLGIEGASIATLIGYAVSDIIVIMVLKKMKLMVISRRFIILAIGLVLNFVIWRLIAYSNLILGLVFSFAYTSLCCLLYKKELNQIIKSIKGLLK